MSTEAKEDDKEPKPTPEEKIVETQHSITLNGELIEYTVVTGNILIREEDEKEGHKAKASIFFTAYTRTNGADVAERPLTFSFNGGPGSSSVWMHLGLLGPRRVWMDDEGNPPPPPYRMVDNEYSLLDKSDLVFIDPVGTGYSRAVQGEKAKQFFEFKKDISTVGEFIRVYTTRYKRWSSPKYLIGESYGTTRAAGLSGYLQNECGMYLNGLMLISSVLNFQTLRFIPNNDLPPALFLPTFAAAAWYHGKLDAELAADLRTTLDEVEAFAEGDYASALMLGDKLSSLKRGEIVDKLARYTGLSTDYIEQTNMRVNIHRFVKELRRDERLTIGRLDARFTGHDADAAGEGHSYDPSYTNIQGVYTSCMNDYVRSELDYENELPYEILSAKVFMPWSYQHFNGTPVDVAKTLRDAMTRNPYLKVFVANGYYDLATPYFATEYTFNHLGLEPDLRKNVSMAYYEAGHMMYVHQPSIAQLKQDLDNFIEG